MSARLGENHELAHQDHRFKCMQKYDMQLFCAYGSVADVCLCVVWVCVCVSACV